MVLLFPVNPGQNIKYEIIVKKKKKASGLHSTSDIRKKGSKLMVD